MPRFNVRSDVTFHSSCPYMPTLGLVCETSVTPNVCVNPELLYVPARKFASVEKAYDPRFERGKVIRSSL